MQATSNYRGLGTGIPTGISIKGAGVEFGFGPATMDVVHAAALSAPGRETGLAIYPITNGGKSAVVAKRLKSLTQLDVASDLKRRGLRMIPRYTGKGMDYENPDIPLVKYDKIGPFSPVYAVAHQHYKSEVDRLETLRTLIEQCRQDGVNELLFRLPVYAPSTAHKFWKAALLLFAEEAEQEHPVEQDLLITLFGPGVLHRNCHATVINMARDVFSAGQNITGYFDEGRPVITITEVGSTSRRRNIGGTKTIRSYLKTLEIINEAKNRR